MGRDFNIQGLRAAAAYGVVVHHIIDSLRNYIAIGRFTSNPYFGSTGVNIFFAISGYVMVLTTFFKPVTPGRFLKHRITRIIPMYWLLTAISTILILCGISLLGKTPTNIHRIVTSFLFLPNFSASGELIDPIVFPGWTLNYEVMFYTLFAIWLFVPNKKARVWGIALSILIVWILQVFTASLIIDYLGADIVLAFALGVIIWPLAQRVQLRPSFAVVLIPVALLLLASIDSSWTANLFHGRVLVSLGAALLVYCAISLEFNGHSIGRGWLSRQGDASYSVYLIHPFVIQTCAKLSVKTALNSSVAGLLLTMTAMLLASGAAGVLVHRYVENPLNRRIRGRSLEAIMDDPRGN